MIHTHIDAINLHDVLAWQPCAKAKGISIDESESEGVVFSPYWESEDSSVKGFGAIELSLYLCGDNQTPDNHLKAVEFLASKANIDLSSLSLQPHNGYTQEVAPTKNTIIEKMEGFTIRGIEHIGCKVERKWNDEQKQIALKYAFGKSFNPLMLEKNFQMVQLHSYTTQQYINENGKTVSLRRYATPCFPIFAFVYHAKNKQGVDCEWGVIYQPEWRTLTGCKNMHTFTYMNDGLKTSDIKSPLLGDKVALDVFNKIAAKEYNENSVREAVYKNKTGEDMDSHRPDRVQHVIYCKGISDALHIYYRLNNYSNNITRTDTVKGEDGKNEAKQSKLFYHVAWSKDKEAPFNYYHNKLLVSFAAKTFAILNVDNKGKNLAYKIGKQYSHIRLAFLPERLKNLKGEKRAGTYHPNLDVRSFFTQYQMTRAEQDSYKNNIECYFFTLISRSIPIDPFVKVINKNGTYKYQLNTTCLYSLLAAHGYCRVSNPHVGKIKERYVHIDGCFVSDINDDLINNVISYILDIHAGDKACDGSGDDYIKMKESYSKLGRITPDNGMSLPQMDINYQGGYDQELDHLFFKNCALKITPDDIKVVSYDSLDFHVEVGSIMPYDFDMPCDPNDLPFEIFENPDYIKRLSELDKMKTNEANYTMKDIELKERELEEWSQINKWKFKFKNKDVKSWWKPLQVIRGFANNEWKEEEELLRKGDSFSDAQEQELYSRMANLIYSLGRPLFRFKGNGVNYAPFLTENSVLKRGSADGGSGKSIFANVFIGCAGKVLAVDAKPLKVDKELATSFANYIHHTHRVVHIEDLNANYTLEPLFNYITSGFSMRQLHKDGIVVPLNESPGFIISSNYPQSSTQTSSTGRIVPTGFSHRFFRGNSDKNEKPRKISDIMPELDLSPDKIDKKIRDQIILIDAMAIQFCMRAKDRVMAYTGDIKESAQRAMFGDNFIKWANIFFSYDISFGRPRDLTTMFNDYVEVCESSADKKNKYSIGTFKKKLNEYCDQQNWFFQPNICLSSASEKDKGYIRKKLWQKIIYFADVKIWGIGKKREVWEYNSSCTGIIIFKEEKDIPTNKEELQAIFNKDKEASSNPALYYDDEIVTLTTEEQQRYDDYMSGLQRRRYAPKAIDISTPVSQEAEVPEEYPF